MRVTPWLLALTLGLVGGGGCAAVPRPAALRHAGPAPPAPPVEAADAVGDDDPCADPDMLDGLDDPCYVDVPPEEVRRSLGAGAVAGGRDARSPR